MSSADDSDISDTIKKLKEEKKIALEPKKLTKIEKELEILQDKLSNVLQKVLTETEIDYQISLMKKDSEHKTPLQLA